MFLRRASSRRFGFEFPMARDCTLTVDMWQEVRYEPWAMKPKRFTTVEAAAAAKIPRATLQHWIKTGRITAPPVRLVGGRAVRMWTEAQTKQIRRLKGTPKSRSKKQRTKRKNSSG